MVEGRILRWPGDPAREKHAWGWLPEVDGLHLEEGMREYKKKWTENHRERGSCQNHI